MLLQKVLGRYQVIKVVAHNLRPYHKDVLPPLTDPANAALDPLVAILDLKLAKDSGPHILIIL